LYVLLIEKRTNQNFAAGDQPKPIIMFGKAFQTLKSNPVKFGLGFGLAAVGNAALFLSFKDKFEVHASSDAMDPPRYPWAHRFPWQAFDHASIRRGFQVYKQVCATCHSLDKLAYRHLVDACYTEDEMKAIAAETEFQDGPDSEGEMFTRPGKLSDWFPKPYANEQAARFVNNGALPPDLSLMVKARDRHEDYLFQLLTGYRDPPAGIQIRQGLFYNPYFAGGAIAMPQALVNGQIQYDDGTEATISQMSKDVTNFLSWAAEPHQDERRKMGIKMTIFCVLVAVPSLYIRRQKWATLKTRVIQFKDMVKKKH
jgi:ubiquinol-cytochrome c reductase cytochrome c1 subunit